MMTSMKKKIIKISLHQPLYKKGRKEKVSLDLQKFIFQVIIDWMNFLVTIK